jgi:tRNA-specific 2-thiouridylase
MCFAMTFLASAEAVGSEVIGSALSSSARPRIVVGLSGGVDSSAAAALLQEQGYDVVGVTLWLMRGKGQCCSDGLVDAAVLCEQLGIEHHVVDTRDLFEAHIVNYLVAGYGDGITPLPCSQCNKSVKFGPMLDWAERELGIPQIATGHYAQVRWDPDLGRYQLLRAVDRHKDQSYFLYDLSQAILGRVVFPLGAITKPETRRIASAFELNTADKPESQDLCLIEAHGSMQRFLDQHIPLRSGEIVDTQGHVLGHHEGIHHYTVGQRKGLGIAAPHPLYVVRLDPALNRVIVGSRQDAVQSEALVRQVNWVSMDPAAQPFEAQVQVRYRTSPVPAQVIPADDTTVKIVFTEPQFGVTPGQAAVWYDGEVLLGGGILQRPDPA